MTHREQLAILALLIVLVLLAILFPRPAASDAPVVSGAVPASEFVPVKGGLNADRVLPGISATPGAISTQPLIQAGRQSARPATPSPAAPAAPSPSASKRVPTPTPVRPRAAVDRTVPASGSESTTGTAKQYAAAILGSEQFECLDALFQRESRWRVDAVNSRSGAYGIPQAAPASKMASAGADWRTNPMTQVKWGIGYVNSRYGGSCNALRHALDYGWY